MTIKDIVEHIMEKLKESGYYSEIPEKDLVKILKQHLTEEYREMLELQTLKMEREKQERGADPSDKEYKLAYSKVEKHLIYETHKLAANCAADIQDLEELI